VLGPKPNMALGLGLKSILGQYYPKNNFHGKGHVGLKRKMPISMRISFFSM